MIFLFKRHGSYGGVRSGRECQLDQLAVVADMRGEQIGRALMNDVFANSDVDLDMTAWVLKEQQALFASFGFKGADPPEDEFDMPAPDATYMRSEAEACA